MKVFMISTDARIFEERSDVRKRMIEYGKLFEELHVIVLTSGRNIPRRLEKLRENAWACATDSRGKLRRVWDGYGLAERLLKSGGDWIVTTQDPFLTGWLGRLLIMQFKKAPLHIQIHTDFLSPYFSRESLKNRFSVFLAGRVLRGAARVRVVSHRIRRSILTRFPYLAGRIDILPIFVDLSRLRGGGPASEIRSRYANHDFIVLMASRLTREKNIELALRAMKNVAARHPKSLLLIVGEGPELGNLRRTTRDLQLERNVVFESWTDNLAPYYRAADIYLLTSNYEGYSRTTIEAMAVGVPVVMTDVGVAGELVRDGETGLVVPVGDAKAATRALLALREDPKQREKLIGAARETISNLGTKEDYLRQYRAILKAALPIEQKPKLCYVMPEYNPDSHTHMSYLGGFVREISAAFDIFLIIERGVRPPDNLGCTTVYLAASRSRLFRLIKLEWALWRARFSGYRTFYIHYSFYAAYVASWIRILTGGRVFYWNCGNPWEYRRAFLRERFERLVYRMISTLVTGTEGMKKRYAKHYHLKEAKIRVMPNWIRTSDMRQVTGDKEDLRNKLSIAKDQKIILFVHRLSRRKGAHYLPAIAVSLPGEAVILAVGDGPERKNLEREIESRGLGRKLRLVGNIPNEKLLAYYVLADVFIMPSDEEGFPRVLLEAMAAGTPFVATDVGGVPEIVPLEARRFIVPAGDVEEFARRIKEVLGISADERTKLARHLQEWVERYDMKSVASTFRSIVLNT